MVLRNRLGWILTLVIEYVFIFILSLKTPLYADDLLETRLSLGQIWQRGIQDYLTTNGRLVGQFIYRLLDNLPILIFALVNAFVFCLFTLLIFKITTRNQLSLFKYIILLAFLLITIPAFGQTILWKAGTGNYLWITTIILLYLISNFHEELLGEPLHYSWFKYLLPFLSFVAGWGNENTSFAVIILSVFIILYQHFFRKVSFKYLQIINVALLTVGYLCLIFAPATRNRTSISETIFTVNNDTYLSKVFTACLNVLLTLPKYYFVLIVSIAILAILMNRYYFDTTKAANALFFIISGILSIMTLIVAPLYTWDGGRSYFGGITFLIIAFFILLPDDLIDFMKQSVLKYAFSLTTITILLTICVGYVGWGIYDWYQSAKAIDQRYEYIQKQVNNGHSYVKINKLSYWPQTKYAVNTGLTDISSDPNYWMNKGYYQYFPGLKKITF